NYQIIGRHRFEDFNHRQSRRQKGYIVLEQDLASAVYESPSRVAKKFQAYLQRGVQRAAGSRIGIGFTKMIFDSIAKKQFITVDLFINCKDGLAGDITETRDGNLSSRGNRGLGSAHGQNIGVSGVNLNYRGAGGTGPGWNPGPRFPIPRDPFYLKAITPNVPARLLCGPAVKNNLLLPPFVRLPPPKSIAQSWSI